MGHLLPSGVGGDAARAYVLAQRPARGAEAIGLVVVDRYVGICSLALLAATGLVFWSNQAVPELQQVSAGAAGLLWADRLLALAAPSRLAGRALMDRLVRFARTLGQYRRHGGLVAGLMALSFVVQVTRGAASVRLRPRPRHRCRLQLLFGVHAGLHPERARRTNRHP